MAPAAPHQPNFPQRAGPGPHNELISGPNIFQQYSHILSSLIQSGADVTSANYEALLEFEKQLRTFTSKLLDTCQNQTLKLLQTLLPQHRNDIAKFLSPSSSLDLNLNVEMIEKLREHCLNKRHGGGGGSGKGSGKGGGGSKAGDGEFGGFLGVGDLNDQAAEAQHSNTLTIVLSSVFGVILISLIFFAIKRYRNREEKAYRQIGHPTKQHTSPSRPEAKAMELQQLHKAGPSREHGQMQMQGQGQGPEPEPDSQKLLLSQLLKEAAKLLTLFTGGD